MAEFKMFGPRKLGVRKLVVRDDGIVEMNPHGTKLLSVSSATVQIFSRGTLINEHVTTRDSISAADGAEVMPYFLSHDRWHVIMVEQFRIAVPGQTLEAAGGEVDGADILASMARELEEEARIRIEPERIKVVFSELAHPSILNARMYGGIVELQEHEVPEELTVGGEHQFGEYTVLVVLPLIELLRQRDSRSHNLDVLASRLLDEVAKDVGLLVKNY